MPIIVHDRLTVLISFELGNVFAYFCRRGSQDKLPAHLRYVLVCLLLSPTRFDSLL